MAANADLHAVFFTCAVTDGNVRARIFQNEGFTDIASVGVMDSDTDVTEMAARMQRRTGAARVVLTTVQIKYIQALVW